MAASKDTIYGEASLVCKARKVDTSSTDEIRYLLDDVWDRNGLLTCLQLGLWNFAKRSSAIDYDPSIDTTDLGGYQYAFQKPDDFVRTAAVCTDPYFRNPLVAYDDATGYWWADLTKLYVQYVSNDTSYGLDYSLWPANFERMVGHYFANEVIGKLTTDDKLEKKVEDKFKYWLNQARGTDAMEQPAKFPPRTGWAAARGGSGSRGYKDRGGTGQLIG